MAEYLELSHVRWGMYMMNNCEFPGGVLNHQLSVLLVDGQVVIRDTTKVVKQNRPLHIKDPKKIPARSVGVVDPSGWKQRKLKSSPYSAPNTDLALMACSLLILRAEIQCEKPTMVSHENFQCPTIAPTDKLF
ncbi:BnaC01g31450D [Brassica napus]|uniref:(rape) hypothetical protein n=1 Tax=Brassica napus TaxID=3708 RepID=A0A078IE62_BRANA|nr:unnamed protein product [Brassica napus]CDY48291.1 BnaC01g31450D [Brassica napus]